MTYVWLLRTCSGIANFRVSKRPTVVSEDAVAKIHSLFGLNERKLTWFKKKTDTSYKQIIFGLREQQESND